jgi:hypothetical protein
MWSPIVIDNDIESEAVEQIVDLCREENAREQISVVVNVKDKLPRVDDKFRGKIQEISSEKFVIAFQSASNGKFFVVWRLEEIFVLKVLDNMKQKQLFELCDYIVYFLTVNLMENHAGECDEWLGIEALHFSSNFIDLPHLFQACSHVRTTHQC